MKKIIITTVIIEMCITGCAQKPMATTVIDLAGNKVVAGWDEQKTATSASQVKKQEKERKKKR